LKIAASDGNWWLPSPPIVEQTHKDVLCKCGKVVMRMMMVTRMMMLMKMMSMEMMLNEEREDEEERHLTMSYIKI